MPTFENFINLLKRKKKSNNRLNKLSRNEYMCAKDLKKPQSKPQKQGNARQ